MSEIEDQGKGVLFSHMVIAEEYLRQNGKKKTDAEMKKIVMKLAREKADSYTPSEDLGRNPEPRTSQNISEAYAPWLYGKNSIVNSLDLNQTEKKAFLIELDGALTNVIQVILKYVYKLRVSRSPSASLTDPKQITSFEYVQKSNKMNEVDREKYDAMVAVHRQMRGIMRSYLVGAIIPLINTDLNSFYKKFQKVYQDVPSKIIKSPKVYQNLMKNFGVLFLKNFSSTKITDYFGDMKVDASGKVSSIFKKK